jgi:peptidoglycan/xylan/chitin deacetylase (PgdA/CDA1 family)
MDILRNIATPRTRPSIILFYHGVIPKVVDQTVQGVHHSVRQFEDQMRFLSAYRDVVPLSDVADCLSRGLQIPPNQVVVTFDDGFQNNLEFAAEIVAKYGIRPALFVCSKNIRNGEWFPTSLVRTAIWFTQRSSIQVETINRSFSTGTKSAKKKTLQAIMPILKRLPENMVNSLIAEAKSWLSGDQWGLIRSRLSSEDVLSWDDLRELSERGWEIGSHTRGHVILHKMQPEAGVRRQVSGSKEDLTQELGCCDYFAFPNGEQGFVSSRSVQEVEIANYSIGLSAVPGTLNGGVNRLVLPRRLAPKSFPHFFFVLNNSHRYDHVYRNWLGSLGLAGAESIA